MKSKDIQEGRYTKREISDNYQLLWRILTDLNEIEVVMKVKGTGYVRAALNHDKWISI